MSNSTRIPSGVWVRLAVAAAALAAGTVAVTVAVFLLHTVLG